MATKAERFKAEEIQLSRPKKKAKARKNGAAEATAKKPHNLSKHAERKARVVYEESAGRPSRKSTRKSEHHQRAASTIERANQQAQRTPEARAARAGVRAVKVRGKR